jgi:hypothetical protein
MCNGEHPHHSTPDKNSATQMDRAVFMLDYILPFLAMAK